MHRQTNTLKPCTLLPPSHTPPSSSNPASTYRGLLYALHLQCHHGVEGHHLSDGQCGGLDHLNIYTHRQE